MEAYILVIWTFVHHLSQSIWNGDSSPWKYQANFDFRFFDSKILLKLKPPLIKDSIDLDQDSLLIIELKSGIKEIQQSFLV